ncbi:MAG: hypothetical protein H0V89_11605, partial [Deltaproteobacteria bacterium]|nr:hypothetical protein [Deltaproteobacteria bacterium]
SAFDAFGWRARRLPAAEWIGEPERAFASAWTLTAPAAPPPAIEDVPYRAIRAFRPASLIPVLRLEPASAPDLGPVMPRGGAWLQGVDAVENVSIDGLFLLGADLLAAGSVTWRGWRPDLSLDLSHAARAPGLSPERLDRVSVSVDLPIYAGLSVDASALGYRLDSGSEEGILASGAWTTIGLALDDRRFEGGLWGTAARTATPWLRAEAAGTAIGRLGHEDHRLTLGGRAAWTDRRVEDENRLFLGGDHPAAWLTARLQESVSFPSLVAYADTGDALAVARLGWQVPFAADGAERLGPLIGTDVLGFLGVDVGDTWDLGGRPAARIEGLADVRWRAELAGSPWDGMVRAAWTPQSEPRFYLSFGSGW